MTSTGQSPDAASRRPWPRFTRTPDAPAPREIGPHEPWPRWGWFPREQRTWTFAPAPGLTAGSAQEPNLLDDSRAHAGARPSLDAPEAQPPTDATRSERREPEVELVPVRRSVALVPIRGGEVTLSDVARAVRKVAPAAAVVGAAAAAAMTLFRRR
ncbi:MAG: hypothetical protein AB7F65_03305 [Dehalococcoidia bacterium]